jgi:hypothetical protein
MVIKIFINITLNIFSAISAKLEDLKNWKKSSIEQSDWLRLGLNTQKAIKKKKLKNLLPVRNN